MWIQSLDPWTMTWKITWDSLQQTEHSKSLGLLNLFNKLLGPVPWDWPKTSKIESKVWAHSSQKWAIQPSSCFRKKPSKTLDRVFLICSMDLTGLFVLMNSDWILRNARKSTGCCPNFGIWPRLRRLQEGPDDRAPSWWSKDQSAETIIEMARRSISPWRLDNYSRLVLQQFYILCQRAAGSQTGEGEATSDKKIHFYGGTTAILCIPEDGVIDDTGVIAFTSPTWQRKRSAIWERLNMWTWEPVITVAMVTKSLWMEETLASKQQFCECKPLTFDQRIPRSCTSSDSDQLATTLTYLTSKLIAGLQNKQAAMVFVHC